MPYATLAEVLEFAPKLQISAASKPSTADATKTVEAVNAQVEAIAAGLGYAVPITAPKSVAILKDIVIQGATARLLKSMFYGVRDPKDVGANDAYREFLGKLRALQDPDDPLTLEDAPLNTQYAKMSADIASSAFEYFDYDPNRPTRDQVF